MPSLLEMPDVVMKKILEECGFVAVQRLRKTCHTLRKFIDDTSPDPQFSQVSIQVDSKKFSLIVSSSTEAPLNLTYEKNPNGTIISNWRNKKLLADIDFLDVFCQDFELLLRGQKSKIGILSVYFRYYTEGDFDEDLNLFGGKFLEKIQTVLSKTTLKVETLDLMLPNQESTMAILPFLDEKSIKCLKFLDAIGTEDRILYIEKVIELPQWKSARELSIGEFSVSVPIQNFFHFENASIYIETISNEDVMLLKDNFLNSPSFSLFQINLTVENTENTDFFIENYGEPYLDNRYQSETAVWFFKKDKDTVLKFLINSNCVVFRKIGKGDVPVEALVVE